MSKETASKSLLSNIYSHNQRSGKSSQILQTNEISNSFDVHLRESDRPESQLILPILNPPYHQLPLQEQPAQSSTWSEEFSQALVAGHKMQPHDFAYQREMRHSQQMTHQMVHQTRPLLNQRFINQDLVQDLDSIPQELWHQQFEQLKLENIQDDFDNQMNETTDWQSQFEEMWAKSKINREDIPATDFNQFDTLDLKEGYVFEQINPYLSDDDTFSKAMEMKENHGDLHTITLLLEASLQKDPTADKWYELGLVHAENENETKGILALESCLNVDPAFKKAMVSLAVAMVNEGRTDDALQILATWLGVDLLDTLDLENEFMKRLTNDPDLQIGLGLVFYLKGEYEKTISCFETALASRPGDYMLWSRVGATMSNSGNSNFKILILDEGAVEAYYKALEINPNFCRGWYNLGVSCMNMGCFSDAAKYFLKALGMAESRTVWDTVNRYEHRCSFGHESETKNAQIVTSAATSPAPSTPALHFGNLNSDRVISPPPVSYKSLIDRINGDSKELWNLDPSRDPETTVMYREMTLWGLDRDREDDYVRYFEMKQKLALHQASLDYFIKYEMEIMGLNDGDEIAYFEMKKQMSGHSKQQSEWCKEEMPKLGLKWNVPSDYTTYYGIKLDIAANVNDEIDLLDRDGALK